ncbi:N-acetylmuramoyl-L-alanine amidase [Listeria booriae]|uniref:N-acetylmuramoyl-L-alanine amidase n=1 Tax=Listeria booriae TaxID=1552123 RepID=UPI00162942E5|nr:N-acetylmuramoyl-L-alanine amidase [Listeria booriae]MBC2149483.1 N-acetylmuramoyl-L-alanine amidase [Listeria booriae]
MKINDLKLAIFAGHGGADPGASSAYGKESEKTLELMLEATKYARSLGITVLNNRTTNTARIISVDAKKANNAKVDAVIEIHFDSATATANGTTGFYCEGSESSKSLAQKVNDRVDDYFRDRDIKPDTSTRHGRLGILRETHAPAMLLETCFISNKGDTTTYNTKKALIAQAIVHGALDYFNIPIPKDTPEEAPESPKPSSPANSFAGKKLVSKTKDLRFYAKPSWADKDVAGTVDRGLGFPVVLGKVDVNGSQQYKVQNSKGKTFYITASSKYVELKNK